MSPLSVAAQAWYLDLYAGWSYANLTGGSASWLGGDYKSGFGGGVGAELMLNEDWGWEFGLWYVQKGTQGQWSTSATGEGYLPMPNDTFDGTVTLDYVEVPILVNVYFPVSQTSQIRGYVGPAFAFMTSAKADGDYNGSSKEFDLSGDLDDADITVMIGAGGQFKVGERYNLLLDVRWDIGTTNIAKGDVAELRTSAFIVSVGFGYPLTRYDE
jgi:hypothetical protein